LDGIALVFLLAIVVEKLVQIFKDIVYALPFLPDKFRPLTLEILSLGCGLLLAFQTNINALELINVKIPNPMIGVGITGLVIGKGANFAHDFFGCFSKGSKPLIP
jgi:xanthosine utilization system XapX-like protein